MKKKRNKNLLTKHMESSHDVVKKWIKMNGSRRMKKKKLTD